MTEGGLRPPRPYKFSLYRACYICKTRVANTVLLNTDCPISTCVGKIDSFLEKEEKHPMMVSRSYNACNECGYRFKDKKPGELCLNFQPDLDLCPGVVVQRWEEATPLPVPLDVHVRRFFRRVLGRRSS